MTALIQTSAVAERGTEQDVPGTVVFSEGLVGLPDARRFSFETSSEIDPLLRMRCLDQGELSFLVVDPRLVAADYRPRWERKALETNGMAAGKMPLVLVLTHIAPRIDDCTANLLAPLLINPETMLGLQVVLDPAAHSTRHPLVPKTD
jgi:flagellar assembly factor FliW